MRYLVVTISICGHFLYVQGVALMADRRGEGASSPSNGKGVVESDGDMTFESRALH